MVILEENEALQFWEERGAICYIFKAAEINLEIAKTSVAIFNKLTKGRPRCAYIDTSNVKSMPKEVRDYYATSNEQGLLKAIAVFTPSAISKVIATFYLNFSKPEMPFRIFSSKEKALEWLIELEKAETPFSNNLVNQITD